MKLSVTQRSSESATEFSIRFGSRTFELQIERPGVRVENYDFVVWPVLLHALKHGESIELDQPVTDECRFNAGVMQAFLHRHLRLPPIELRAAGTASSRLPPRPRTILPFSGVVDSCFSLLYHHFELGRRIEAAAVVKGLDLFDEAEYEQCCERCRPLLALTGTELVRVRTDVRREFVTDLGWKLHSDFTLAGILQAFHGEYGQAFISGDGDAGLLAVADCFRTPFLNERLFFLFGSEAMLLQNFEGANHTKAQKIEFLARFPEVRQNLRVCWRTRKHSNCGLCIKCVMTQLALIAVLGEPPPCFPTPVDAAALAGVFQAIRDSAARDPDSPAVILPKDFAAILRLAEKHRVRHPLLDSVERFCPSDPA